MKRQLLFAAALFASALGFNANAQLQNADFSADPNDIVTVTTQGYQGNVPAGSDQIAGLQPVKNWTRNHETPKPGTSDDGYTGGVFAYGSENLLNNKVKAPAQGPDGNSEGVALGVLGVWEGVAQYTQEVTLPAGNYVLTYAVYNGINIAPLSKNLFGFIANDNTEYLSEQKSFAIVGEWQNVYVPFTLENETTGKISVGVKGAGGSGNAPHLFIDNISCTTVTDAELELAKAKAAKIAELNQYTFVGVSPAAEKLAAVNSAKTIEAVEAIQIPTYIFTLTTSNGCQLNTEDGIKIKEVGTPLYLVANSAASAYAITPNKSTYINYSPNTDSNYWSIALSSAYGWTITATEDGYYKIAGDSNHKRGNDIYLGTDATNAGSSCYGNKNNANIYWTIAEYNPAYYVTVTDAEWATWVTPADIDFTGVDAYIVKEITDGKAQLVKVDNAPEGTPVIINAEEGTYQLDTAEDATKVEDNKLKISDGETVKGAGYYVLANISDEVGFYELDANYTLAKGKVYLEYKADNGVKFVGFDFGGETTAIKSVETAAENAVIYNLAGQRVQNPSAGIYIINGKKVLVK